MADVVWRQAARDDIDGIIEYIERFDPIAAAKIGGRLLLLGESLADFPQRGRPVGGGCREMTIVPPFVLRYQVSGDSVTILSVRHGRRRPLA